MTWHRDSDREVLSVELCEADDAGIRLDAFGDEWLARSKVGRGHDACVRKWR